MGPPPRKKIVGTNTIPHMVLGAGDLTNLILVKSHAVGLNCVPPQIHKLKSSTPVPHVTIFGDGVFKNAIE